MSDKPGRREALEAAAITCGAGAAALAVWPLAAAVVDAGSDGQREAPWVDVAAAGGLPEGEPVKAFARARKRDGWTVAEHDLGAVWVVKRGSTVVAFSAVCPHLGCLVDKQREGPGFSCPCHTSRFGPDGAALSGPAPRGLDPLPVRVENGRVLVQVLEFAAGTAARRTV
jgi:Rieske Fe-S protein